MKSAPAEAFREGVSTQGKDLFQPARVIGLHQKIVDTEFSCSDFGGDKAAWITDMFAHIEEYPRLCAAVWWNWTDYAADGTVARQYRIDHNEDYLSAFRAGLSRQRRTGESPP